MDLKNLLISFACSVLFLAGILSLIIGFVWHNCPLNFSERTLLLYLVLINCVNVDGLDDLK
jgi:hypothetical protein